MKEIDLKASDLNGKYLDEAMQDDLRILLEKPAGSLVVNCDIKCANPAMGLNGIAILIEQYSQIMEVSVPRILAILFSALVTPAGREAVKQ